jgi:tRNA wybutosine-synthesizing protein 2
MRLVKVPRERAERVRKKISAMRALRKDVRIFEDGESVLIPLKEGFDELRLMGLEVEIVDGNARSRSCYISPHEQVREMLRLPKELDSKLPQKWEMFGDVLVLRLPDQLLKIKAKVAEAYAGALHARTVCQESVHLENRIRYKFDVARVMYSSGNFPEKKRMSELDCSGETVVDMFAGIGYFTLPLAVHANAKMVVACEINPLAFSYLRENIALNSVEAKVEPVLGDNRILPGQAFADRVLMGYVGTTHEFLPKAFSLVRPGGTIHYHETCPINEWPERPLRRISDAAAGRRFHIGYKGEVKSFAPSVSHYVIDVTALD